MALKALAILFLPATLANAQYVGSRACAPCHKAIYDSYRQTAMGRSMSGVVPAAQPGDAIVTASQFKRLFSVKREGGALFQTESEPGVFEARHALSYTIGSGVNGMSYAVRIGDHLFQAPLSYYARAAKWDLSPGFEHADYGFSRPILPACIACHSGRPQAVADRQGQFRVPPFKEVAIGCENCHGPGENHILRRDPAAIVNPARLEPRLAESICMNCHQGGDARVTQPGKTVFDFRPGEWLSDTIVIAKLATSLKDEDLLEHHSAMEMSRCFTASEGKLSCLTCHDVHQTVPPAKAASTYRTKCQSCHASPTACGLPIAARTARNANNCVACHMPKRDVATISHSALTNHRIIRATGQKLPPTQPAGPVVITSPLKQPLPKVTELRILGELSNREPALRQAYVSVLDQLAKDQPEDAIVQSALGRRALLAGDYEEALKHLERSSKLGYTAHTLAEDSAEAYVKLSRHEEAIGKLDAALVRDPYVPSLHKSRVLRLISLKRYDEARAAMKRYLELFPQDSFMRGLLAKVDK